MSTDTYINGVNKDYEKPLNTMDSVEVAATSPDEIRQVWENVQNTQGDATGEGPGTGQEKDPSISTIEAAISSMNSQITKTRCAYSYDEATKRINIKVYDKETEELIREVPPEKSLEVLKKVWEIAGIIIDEKR
ncbi:MAG: flagellar protein FlaG [Butyribacter sp.]|nr:flagellar protein FlaG [bacterium]MDY3853712.1 flagellar protein FlaG [Butyribacter sp.]